MPSLITDGWIAVEIPMCVTQKRELCDDCRIARRTPVLTAE